MKTKRIPFDFTRINENGLIIETKCGLKVSVLRTNAKGKYPIVVLIDNGTFESCVQYDKTGTPKAAWEDLKLIMRVHTDCEQRKPKFQKGDWVISEQGMVQQITDVRENIIKHTYEYNTISYSFGILSYGYFNENVKGMRRWDINDAKDGDILASTNGLDILIFKEIYNSISFSSYYNIRARSEYFWTSANFIPATKEQRDLLFKKMKEAGYEWNSDKKELHKIEEVKKRRMTNRELSWWLRDCPEEHREWKYKTCSAVYTSRDYSEEKEHNPVANNIVIRKNGEEWKEPLIEE